MVLILESTTQVHTLVTPTTGIEVRARLWVGHTDTGIPVQVLITRIAAPEPHDHAIFLQELHAANAPTPEVLAFPLRFML